MSYVDPFAYTITEAVLEVRFNGQPVGLSLNIRSKQSDEVKAFERKLTQKLVNDARKNKGKFSMGDADQLEQTTNGRCIAHVSGWQWDKDAPGIGGQKPKFSEESLRGFLSHPAFGPVLREQILEKAEEESDFLALSA